VSGYGDGALVIDEPRRTVTVRGTPVQLTPTEWGILAALATVPGRVYSRFELINKVRGYEFEGYERTVDSHVKNLRRKLEEDPGSPRVIVTVLGGGYRLGLTRDD
jgi:DNA-binding response OmpR family regulator